MPAWEAKRAVLSRNDARAVQRFWTEYQEKLLHVRKRLVFNEPGIGASAEGSFQMLHPRRQPVWGRMMMAIAVTVNRICLGDGHARAERREETWYHF